ncbi:TonB-dependent receptor [Chondrinema litorale]|uniref:TonB-dependent receptor n=1 Tax=Chondrinema litorale TaxID=2994555 RepID=UPI00254387FA|nr:TonB-dependent receptor [Chondrinema litorale]UZR97877.1 TonB-dependent receptor [Chondrinema litorale]
MKKSLPLFFTIIVLGSLYNCAIAQTQTIRGTILDAQADYPLIGATVIVVGSDPVKGSTTDLDGKFKIENVSTGRHTLLIQYVGYKTITLPNVLVTAGKESVLNVKLEESVEQLDEIVVTSESDKDLPNNEMAKVSARTFSLEEVTRYSGGRNDVARLASNFAGVSTADDSRNDIVVRGNSPTGMLWRIEGVSIANTNHFSTLGTTGGPVSALNTNLLRSSDFLTGAFPAEYGNAVAAVFDINFRSGNTEKYEFTGQMSAFSGMEFMAEGPISKKNDASFIASYRYGIASLAATGTSATPYYQDFSFKLNSGKTKLGRFELFGMGGLSNIDFLGDDIDETDLFANPNEDAYVDNQLALFGLKHTISLNKTTYLQSVVGFSSLHNTYEEDALIRDESGNTIQKYRSVDLDDTQNRINISSTLNKKFSARLNMRAGIVTEIFGVNSLVDDRDNRVEIPDENNDGIPDYFIRYRDTDTSFPLIQTFAQGEYKFTDDFSLTAGLHSQYLEFNGSFALEPRAALSWQFRPNQRLSIAYGYHSQMVPLPTLLLEEVVNGVNVRTNEDLDFIRSHHFVLGYDRRLGNDWRLKAETYYQQLTKIPIESAPSSFAAINDGSDFAFSEKGSLVSEGTGFNYGLELTLEKFFSQGYYMLLTTSLFDSRYKGSDGVERNTAFNNQYVVNLLFGKEWKVGKEQRNALTFDTKLANSGGRFYTPINLEATRANLGREVLYEDEAYSKQYDPYFRWDVKFGFRLNSRTKNISHQFFVDFQNVTDRRNVFVERYNEVTDEIDIVEQIGFFPDVLYRIQF